MNTNFLRMLLAYLPISLLFFPCLSAFANDSEYCVLPLSGASVCPKVSDLKYNTKTSEWSTDDDWKSTTSSFTKKITIFLGAQWKGVQMGHLLCLYKGPNANEFPVSMHKNIIVQSPKSLLDNLNPKGAQYVNPWVVKEAKTLVTMDCYPENSSPCDCPWIQFQEKTQSVEDVIESIQKPSIYPPWAM